jgi:hypothetical protein
VLIATVNGLLSNLSLTVPLIAFVVIGMRRPR